VSAKAICVPDILANSASVRMIGMPNVINSVRGFKFTPSIFLKLFDVV